MDKSFVGFIVEIAKARGGGNARLRRHPSMSCSDIVVDLYGDVLVGLLASFYAC